MNQEIKSYKDLTVWQKSMDLVVNLYQVTEKMPTHEQFGLISQMRRAAVSLPSNIAEGSRRKTNTDRLRFLNIAFASGSELETQLEISTRLSFISDNDYSKLKDSLTKIMKMLNKMLEKYY